MQDVELVEDDGSTFRPPGNPHELAAGDAAPDGTGSVDLLRTGPATRRRARRWRPVAVTVAVLLGLAVVVTDRREAHRLAALRDVPGMLAPLDRPVAELWRFEGQLSEMRGIGGLVVGPTSEDDGGSEIVALDPLTGRAVWRVEALPPGEQGRQIFCPDSSYPGVPDGRRDDPVLACLVAHTTLTQKLPDGSLIQGPGDVRLLALDTATGDVLQDRAVGPGATVTAIGHDLLITDVVLGADGVDHVQVVRIDARDGAQRWSFTTPGGVEAADEGWGRVGWTSASADRLVVQVASGTTWILSADGELLGSWAGDSPAAEREPVYPFPGRDLLIGSTPDGERTVLLDPETGRSVAVKGYPATPTPDDGSLADLVLTQVWSDGTDASGPTLTAFDLATGDELWSGSIVDFGGLAVLDGRVLVRGEDAVSSLDGRTGGTQWSTPIERPGWSQLVTDGRLVLLALPDAVGGPVVAAYAVVDGRKLWEVDVGRVDTLWVIDGHLYAQSDGDLVALG